MLRVVYSQGTAILIRLLTVEMLTAVTVAMPTAAMQQHVTTDAAHTLNLT
jgi:hypothetical protein